jgi:Na+/melibiose symporter-like transporter
MILKPLFAHWSDNSKFRLGRRKPFMLFGCGFYAFFLVILFNPPDSLTSPVTIAIWFGSFYVLFFLADTVCSIPYLALGPELSNDTKEREKLYILLYSSQYIGVIFTSLAPALILYFINSCDCTRCDSINSPIEKTDCIENCKSLCSVKNNQNSFLYMCLFVGLFFVFSIILLSNKVKEQKDSFNKEEKRYYVPTIFRMMNNKPFLKLLIPWILDITVAQIFATISPFFITYIINPQKYCVENNFDLSSAYCNSTIWLGLTIFIFFVFCILSMIFFWHWVVAKIGKKKSWQIYSLMTLVTICLFLFCGEGMMGWMLIFSMVNAFPAGGAYLNDVLLTDVIDYDEFITGKRNEGIYEVFSNFTPKIVGILAQSIPLTILSCNFNNF